MPQRIQLSRKKGWRKPEGAVTVARPSRWGNPFKVGAPAPTTGELVRDRAHAVDLYRAWLPSQPGLIEEARLPERARAHPDWLGARISAR